MSRTALRWAYIALGMSIVALLLNIAVFVRTCEAATLWEDEGFKLEVVKNPWVNSEHFRDWTGIRCGVTLPRDAWMYFNDVGAVEVYLPCKGKWVTDIGIVVSSGCAITMETAADTRGGAVGIMSGHGCDRQGGRVLIMIMVPKLLGTHGCYPTEARWVRTKVDYDVEED